MGRYVMPDYRYKQILYVGCFISCFESLNNVDNNKHISVNFGFILFKQNLRCAKSYRKVNIQRLVIVQSVLFYDWEEYHQNGLYNEVTCCI